MKCLACDVILSDQEAVKKNKWGNFLDLCNHCGSEPDSQEPIAEYIYLPITEVDDETNI